ncbi:LOW QUALITY PROTEIN: hypothetical protein QYF61_014590 [Mycteria americana]|uniref:Uncharacterized protein n=1 Tax=Mycteria americana TaxID=33587 RepID=A0AAN7NHU2_MYCAM|nr:LOW QUALITY PROTEIN: hypothetical protein QYF61_014590 [Mycteria americana]
MPPRVCANEDPCSLARDSSPMLAVVLPAGLQRGRNKLLVVEGLESQDRAAVLRARKVPQAVLRCRDPTRPFPLHRQSREQAFHLQSTEVPQPIPRDHELDLVFLDPSCRKRIRLLRAPSNLALNVSRDGASTTSLGNLFQCLTTFISESTLFQFKTIAPCPVTTGLAKKSVPIFPIGPLYVLEGCYKVSPQPSLLQAEQPQLSQPVLTGEVLQPSDHFRGPPWYSLQQLHVLLVLRTPELDAVLQVESHQSGVEGQNHFPQPAGHASLDAAQDTVGLLGCKRTLSAHPQVLFRRAALNHIIPQLVLKPRIALTQDPALGLVEPHEVHTGPLLQLVQVPLDDILSFWCVSCTTQLGVICKLAEGALDLAVNVIDENIEHHWSQYGPLKDTTQPRTEQMVPASREILPLHPLPHIRPKIPLFSSIAPLCRLPPTAGEELKEPRSPGRCALDSAQVVTNLIFPYSGRGFTPLVPNMLSIDSGRKPFLLFFASLAKFSSSCALAFLTPSLPKRAVSLYSSQIVY